MRELWFAVGGLGNQTFEIGPHDTKEELSYVETDEAYSGIKWDFICYREVSPEWDAMVLELVGALEFYSIPANHGSLDMPPKKAREALAKYEAWENK